jgi:hypothetical protein
VVNEQDCFSEGKKELLMEATKIKLFSTFTTQASCEPGYRTSVGFQNKYFENEHEKLYYFVFLQKVVKQPNDNTCHLIL